MQIASSVASEAAAVRPLCIYHLVSTLFWPTKCCEEPPSSLGHLECTARKERARSRMIFVATQMAFINSAPHSHCNVVASQPPSCNQCVLILTTAPCRRRLYKFLLFFIISLSCSWHTDCLMLPSAPHKRTNTIIAGLSVCRPVCLSVALPA